MDMLFVLMTIGLMLLGNITHIVKKVIATRETDGTFSLKKYLTMFPYKTFMVIMAGVGGYLGLMAVGELTYVTAFMAGFMANSLGGVEAKDAKE